MNNQVEQIKGEMERLDVDNAKKALDKEISRDYECGFANALTLLKNYIHTLQEEPVSEDLEREIEQYMNHNYYVDEEGVICDRSHPRFDFCEDKFKEVARYFANWQEQKDKKILNDEGFIVLPGDEFEKMNRSLINLSEEKEQMMKNAIDSHVNLVWNCPCFAIDWSKIGLNVGDRVKLIIIKEE